MIKQYRITSADITNSSPDDCYIAPDDPIHSLMATSLVGGIGSEAALAAYNTPPFPTAPIIDKGAIQRKHNIKPGTPEWFRLWFCRTELTGETPHDDL
jgi:hypothetical protein